MEEFDQEKAARVWQRVQRREGELTTPPVREDPVELILQSHALAGLYLGMQRMVPGSAGERIRELHQQQKQTLACLRGLCRLKGTAPGLPPLDSGKGTTAERLRACAYREQRLGEAFARLAGEEEFTQVYAQLARQAWERCRTVLEILGSPQ